MYESPIHERKFDVAKFHEFLNLCCTTKNSIVNTEMVTQHQQEIQQIQEGVDLWCNTPSLLTPLLQDYRLKYILCYASFPTTSHNAERGVKLSNHCSLAKRGQAQRSFYATAGSETIKHSNKSARELYAPTNRRKSAQKEGEIIRTKARSMALVRQSLEELKDDKSADQKRKAKLILTSEQGSYKKQRNDEFVAAFKQHQHIPRTTTNRLELRDGITHTALISNRVLFKKMLKNPFRPHIIAELNARGITPTEEELRNYPKLLKRLKTHEGNKESFAPVTDYMNFKWW